MSSRKRMMHAFWAGEWVLLWCLVGGTGGKKASWVQNPEVPSFDFLPCCESTCGRWVKHECRWGQGLFLIAQAFLRRSEGSDGASGYTTASSWVEICITHSWASRSESKGLTSILLESPVDVHWVTEGMGELPTTASETKIGMPS